MMDALLRMVEHWIRLFTDLSLPAAVPLPQSDGRMFAWVRVHHYRERYVIYPTITTIRHETARSEPKLEYVGAVHVLKPQEYGLTLTELAAKYPAPPPFENEEIK